MGNPMGQSVAPPVAPGPGIVPSTPDPQVVQMVYRLLRIVLALLGGLGIKWGAGLDDGTLLVVASGLVELGVCVWTIVEAIRQAQHAHASAVLSAQVGAPVKPA